MNLLYYFLPNFYFVTQFFFKLINYNAWVGKSPSGGTLDKIFKRSVANVNYTKSNYGCRCCCTIDFGWIKNLPLNSVILYLYTRNILLTQFWIARSQILPEGEVNRLYHYTFIKILYIIHKYLQYKHYYLILYVLVRIYLRDLVYNQLYFYRYNWYKFPVEHVSV